MQSQLSWLALKVVFWKGCKMRWHITKYTAITCLFWGIRSNISSIVHTSSYAIFKFSKRREFSKSSLISPQSRNCPLWPWWKTNWLDYTKRSKAKGGKQHLIYGNDVVKGPKKTWNANRGRKTEEKRCYCKTKTLQKIEKILLGIWPFFLLKKAI